MKSIKFIKHFWSYSKLILYFLQKFIFICAKKKLSCLLRFSFTNSRKIFDDVWLLLDCINGITTFIWTSLYTPQLSWAWQDKWRYCLKKLIAVTMVYKKKHFRNNTWMVIGSLITPPAPSECSQGETSIVNQRLHICEF